MSSEPSSGPAGNRAPENRVATLMHNRLAMAGLLALELEGLCQQLPGQLFLRRS